MNLTFDFTGRSVLVTGAARGIGRELAHRFAEAGAQVTAVDHDADELRAAVPAGALAVAADVADTAAVTAAVEQAVGRFGRLDVLVNNAGILRDNVVWKLTDEDWEAVLAVHVGGAFRFTRASVPVFRAQGGGGRIINVTSYSGLRGNTGQANYSTAKAGIVGLTKTTAKELARFGVTVNAISPNAETRMVESIPEAKLSELAAAIPVGRFAAPSEIFPAVAFLASDEAAYITGTVLPVDGGISI